MFSGRRSARAGAPVGAPFAGSASGRTGVEVFSDKTGKPRLITSGNVADFARGKSEPELAARSRTVAAVGVGGSAAPSDDKRVLASPTLFNIEQGTAPSTAADTASATEDEFCSRHGASTEEKKLQRPEAATEFVDYRVDSLSAHPAVDPLLANRQRA